MKTYNYMGTYRDYEINKRNGVFNAVAWDYKTNAPKVFFTEKSLIRLEIKIDKLG